MRGLLLNQYYAVSRSLLLYLVIGSLISAFLLFLSIPYTKMIGALIVILLFITPAFEVLKRESNSGWDKYIMVLPFQRSKIVEGHFVFYIILSIVGVFVSTGIVVVSSLLPGNNSMDLATVAMIINCFSVVIFLGAIVYPFAYLLGANRTDGIILISTMVVIFVYNIVALLYITILQPFITAINSGIDHDILFSILYLIMNTIFLFVSFILTKKIHSMKEL